MPVITYISPIHIHFHGSSLTCIMSKPHEYEQPLADVLKKLDASNKQMKAEWTAMRAKYEPSRPEQSVVSEDVGSLGSR